MNRKNDHGHKNDEWRIYEIVEFTRDANGAREVVTRHAPPRETSPLDADELAKFAAYTRARIDSGELPRDCWILGESREQRMRRLSGDDRYRGVQK